MDWLLLPFNDLRPPALYDLLRLRSLVFVVEQTCVFLDMDGKDPKCHHVLGYEGEQLLACSRIVPPGVSYAEASIGRVATHPEVRGTGAGKALMEQSIAAAEALYGKQALRIGAQLYLQRFYEGFGFVRQGDIYDEDGIDHIIMLRP